MNNEQERHLVADEDGNVDPLEEGLTLEEAQFYAYSRSTVGKGPFYVLCDGERLEQWQHGLRVLTYEN